MLDRSMHNTPKGKRPHRDGMASVMIIIQYSLDSPPAEIRNPELRIHPAPLPGATTPEIVAVAVGMAEVAASGHANAERPVVPGSAAPNGSHPTWRACRIVSRADRIEVFIKPIGYPFPNIPGHIV